MVGFRPSDMRILIFNLFWCEITCDKHTEVYDNHKICVTYSAIGSKETLICNPTLLYLHQIFANTIFTQHESQSRA